MRNKRQHKNDNTDYILFTKWLTLSLAMTLMFSGCGFEYWLMEKTRLFYPASGIQSLSKSELQSEIEHFDQIKGISCSDIPELYDISHLKVGGLVEADMKISITN